MRSFFDSSVLIATFMQGHQHHDPSLAIFATAEKENSCCASHSLAELYSVLTRLPGPHRLSGDQVTLFLEETEKHLTLISLNGQEYSSVIKRAAHDGITGGTVYDALLAYCALKAKAETIYTWNVQHFQRLGAEIAKRTKTP